ncbi:MAG: hypothetical protein DWH96_12295, partial [Planctomycetota bacterium]
SGEHFVSLAHFVEVRLPLKLWRSFFRMRDWRSLSGIPLIRFQDSSRLAISRAVCRAAWTARVAQAMNHVSHFVTLHSPRWVDSRIR